VIDRINVKMDFNPNHPINPINHGSDNSSKQTKK